MTGRAQDLSGGIRLGFGGGVSLLYNPNDQTSIETILSPRWGGVILTGLYYRRASLTRSEWSWYYGGGLHVGFHHRDNFLGEGFSGAPPYVNQGFDLIVGLEYEWSDTPLRFSLDFKPSIELTTERNVVVETFGLTVRYIIRRE